MLLQYFHQTASAKVLAVKQYVMDALEAGRKFLLFAHHQEMLNPLEDAVSKVGTLLRARYSQTSNLRLPSWEATQCLRLGSELCIVYLLSMSPPSFGTTCLSRSLISKRGHDRKFEVSLCLLHSVRGINCTLDGICVTRCRCVYSILSDLSDPLYPLQGELLGVIDVLSSRFSLYPLQGVCCEVILNLGRYFRFELGARLCFRYNVLI